VKQQYKEKYWDKIDRDLAVQLGCLDIRWVVDLLSLQSICAFILDYIVCAAIPRNHTFDVLDGGPVSTWEGVLFEGRLPGRTEYGDYAKRGLCQRYICKLLLHILIIIFLFFSIFCYIHT